MDAAALRLGATALFRASERVSAHSLGSATNLVDDAWRLAVVTDLRTGSQAVESLGGAQFGELAARLGSYADTLEGGAAVQTSFVHRDATSGIRWLLGRAGHVG